jgi:hypothetical protein
MILNPTTPSAQPSFLSGCKVFDVSDSARRGKITRAGAQQSEVRFDDGEERIVSNVHLRGVDELDQSSSKSEEPEQAAIREGREAWHRVCTSWTDWKKVGAAFVIGRTTAMRDAHTNVPKGRGYNAALRAWQKKHGFEGLNNSGDQTRLFRCMENRVAIDRWLVQQSEIERSRLNHPSTIWRRWQASLKPPVSDAEKKPSHIQKLNNSIAALQEENDRMRREIERGGGDLWSPEDRPRDIAKVILGKLTKAKAEKVAREILAALKERGR